VMTSYSTKRVQHIKLWSSWLAAVTPRHCVRLPHPGSHIIFGELRRI
jgi:hypothetical protein